MIENKWVNSGIAVAFAGVLTGLAVWISSGPPVEHAPKGDQPDAPAVPADRPFTPSPPGKGRVVNETEAAPPDAGGLLPKPKG